MAKPKKIRGLDCSAPAVQGMRLAFMTRFNELLEWRKEALDWSDPEGVHSMRVASRRLRSMLRDFLPYLPKRSFASVLKQFKRLADGLGEVRDQDVAIQVLEEIEKKAPAEHAAGLKQFIEKRKELRERRRSELKALLAKGELKKLESDFAAAIEETSAERKRKRVTPAPAFSAVARDIIRDRLKEVEKRSDALFRPLDVEALHQLRIATKRLRYAIELLAPCFPGSISAHAKRAARIQTALGDLHDCDSWILSIGDEMGPAKKAGSTDRLAAFAWLLNHFVKLRTKHVHHAFARWREWEAHDTSGKLRALLKEQKPALATEQPPVEKEQPAQPEAQAQSVAKPQPEIVGPKAEAVAESEAEAVAETDAVAEAQDQVAGEQMRQAL
jgi:CHAD domain-containing protein